MDGRSNISAQCPWDHLNNSCDAGFVAFNTGLAPSYIAIVSCTFSCFGSILILITFFALKDMQTGSQKIITLLAVADLISALGYIVGSSNYIHHYNVTDSHSCETFKKLCIAQAAVTSWSSLVSFCWTVILALYFFLIIIFKCVQVASKLMAIYNIIAWFFPLLIIIPLLATNKLGYAHFAASNWCFVASPPNGKPLVNDYTTTSIILFAGKFWEILSYILVTILYVIIMCAMGKARRQVRHTLMEPRVIHVETRLLAIPIIFILLRMWGTIQFFFSIATSKMIYNHSHCVPQSIFTAFKALAVLQAIGDGGQGWGNAILYIFLSPVIRERLVSEWFGNCARKLEDHLTHIADGDNNHHARVYVSEIQKARKKDECVTENASINESAHLLPGKKATGYNIRKYDTTTCTVIESDGSIAT